MKSLRDRISYQPNGLGRVLSMLVVVVEMVVVVVVVVAIALVMIIIWLRIQR